MNNLSMTAKKGGRRNRKDRNHCRETIRRTLALRVGNAPDACGVAEATLCIWRQMASRLVPVIGTRGFNALFSRSLHIASSTFPWLVIAWGHGDNADSLASLKAYLEECETDVAVESSYTLLVTFTELLTALIGESLTGHLLDPVWAQSSPNMHCEK